MSNFYNKKNLEILTEEFENVKNKAFVKTMERSWIDDTGINPMNVVREFIMEKGLKLYGGLALHEHLKKFKEPLYDKSEFPDYDVFSPNAWEHAKELCDKLYKMGFYIVEARKSILSRITTLEKTFETRSDKIEDKIADEARKIRNDIEALHNGQTNIHKDQKKMGSDVSKIHQKVTEINKKVANVELLSTLSSRGVSLLCTTLDKNKYINSTF